MENEIDQIRIHFGKCHHKNRVSCAVFDIFAEQVGTVITDATVFQFSKKITTSSHR